MHIKRLVGALRTGVLVGLLSLAIASIHMGANSKVHADPAIQVAGKVTAPDGSGVANVVVTASPSSGVGTSFGPATTAADGSYNVSVDAGTYDFHFAAPSGSYFASATQANVTVLADKNVSVQLTPVSRTLNGTLLDAAGNPLADATILLINKDVSKVTTTDASGDFTVQAEAGKYEVDIMPENYEALQVTNGNYDGIDMTTGNVTHTFQLPPVHQLTTVVKDGNGNPLSQLPLQLNAVYSAPFTYNGTTYMGGTSVSEGARTDQNGQFVTNVFDGTTVAVHQLCVIYNQANGANVCNKVPTIISGATTIELDVVLRTYSGRVTDANGNAVMAALSVDGIPYMYNENSDGVTDPNGNFSVSLPADNYDSSRIRWSDPYVANTFAVGVDANLTSADANQNYQLPLSRSAVTVHASDQNGNPISRAVVSLRERNVEADGDSPIVLNGVNYYPDRSQSKVANTSGDAVFQVDNGGILRAGDVCIKVNNQQACTANTLTISGAMTIELTVTSYGTVAKTFSGHLTDANSVSVASTNVALNNDVSGAGSATTDVTGYFETVETPPGIYPGVSIGTPGDGAYYSTLVPIDLSTSDASRNFQLPANKTITVQVKDASGNPMANRQVSFSGQNVYGDGDPALIGGSESFYATYNQNLTTDENGMVEVSVPAGLIFHANQLCANIDDQRVNVCNKTTLTVDKDLSLLIQQSAQDVVVIPDAPTGVTAASPTNTNPVISWNASANAASYDVYRNEVKVGSTTGTTYVDTVSDGTYTYYVKAVAADGVTSSAASNTITVVVDKTAPTVGSFTLTRKTSTQTENFTAPATDNLSGVVSGEYYYGSDPGQGSGTAMTYSGGNLSGTLGTNLPVGSYPIYVRAKDAAGNWGAPTSAKLVVTQTGTSTVTASGSYTPTSANNQLPGLGSSSFVLAQYNSNVNFNNSGVTSASSINFTYYYGNSVLCAAAPTLPGCHKMTATVTGANISSLVFSGANNSTAAVSGLMTVTIDGVATTNNFTLSATSASRVGSGSNNFTLSIYQSNGSLLYKAVNAGTVNIQ